MSTMLYAIGAAVKAYIELMSKPVEVAYIG